jgi:sucrose phosphorylase
MVDLMANHISRSSAYFRDFAQQGRGSAWAGLFITLDKVWPGGVPIPEDVAKIFLRRPEHPFLNVPIAATGETERIWATFGGRDWSEQIDLDVRDPLTRQFFAEILHHFSRNGVKIVRLDAVAYVTKRVGTSCFFVEPDIYEFLDWMRNEAQTAGIELLPEVHAHHSIQDRLAAHGYWVYDFALPLLVLHTLINRSGEALKVHLRSCSRRQITQLDSHDGIPVQPDTDGLIAIDDAQAVVRHCLARGANLSRIFSEAHKARPDYDAHQINMTYYSALDRNDDNYLAARAIQFFTPGVPQVYYVGLLAGANDLAGVDRSGERRAINRQNYSVDEVDTALEQPVVRRLKELIRFRNVHPAFSGDFHVLESGDRRLALAWQNGEQRAQLRVDLDSGRAVIEHCETGGRLQRWAP